jgi:transmembrane sensor
LDNRLHILFQKYFDKSATATEREEFMQQLSSNNNDELLVLMQNAWNNLPVDERGILNDEQANAIINNILGERREEEVVEDKIKLAPLHILKTTWIKYAAAILIILGIGAYFWNKNNSTHSPTLAKSTVGKEKLILPGGHKALLTLSDGSTIILDGAGNGQLALQANSKILKTSDGQLIYESTGQPIPSMGGVPAAAGMQHRENSGAGGGVGTGESIFNTMSTPPGGQYRLTLPDGTKTFLNASSSITYPVTFTTSREVKITGEVYFEVSPNPSKPFIVKNNTEQITVLGTEFNINSYPDEPLPKTTLISGSVKINNKILSPGQAYSNGKLSSTNIEKDIAWTKGLFNFTDVSIEEAMRQISRWYDVEIIYDQGIPKEELYGKMFRNITLQDVLSGFNGVAARFTLKGKKLYVRPL